MINPQTQTRTQNQQNVVVNQDTVPLPAVRNNHFATQRLTTPSNTPVMYNNFNQHPVLQSQTNPAAYSQAKRNPVMYNNATASNAVRNNVNTDPMKDVRGTQSIEASVNVQPSWNNQINKSNAEFDRYSNEKDKLQNFYKSKTGKFSTYGSIPNFITYESINRGFNKNIKYDQLAGMKEKEIQRQFKVDATKAAQVKKFDQNQYNDFKSSYNINHEQLQFLDSKTIGEKFNIPLEQAKKVKGMSKDQFLGFEAERKYVSPFGGIVGLRSNGVDPVRNPSFLEQFGYGKTSFAGKLYGGGFGKNAISNSLSPDNVLKTNNLGKKVLGVGDFASEHANEVMKTLPTVGAITGSASRSNKSHHYKRNSEDYGTGGQMVRAANLMSTARGTLSGPLTAAMPFGLTNFGGMSSMMKGTGLVDKATHGIAGNLFHPAMLATVFAPMLAGIAGQIMGNKHKAKIRGARLSANEVDKQFDRLPGVDSQMQNAVRNMTPYESLSLSMFRVIGLNTGSIGDIYAILKHYVENAQTKDVFESTSLYKNHLKVDDSIYGDGIRKKIKKQIGRGFDKVESGVMNFNSSYNPIQQLSDAIFRGLTPNKAQEQIFNTFHKTRLDDEATDNFVDKNSKVTGLSCSALRLMVTSSSKLLTMGDSYQGKMLGLISGIYDVERYQMMISASIASQGFGIKVNMNSPNVRPDKKGLIHQVPVVSAAVNALSNPLMLIGMAAGGVTGGYLGSYLGGIAGKALPAITRIPHHAARVFDSVVGAGAGAIDSITNIPNAISGGINNFQVKNRKQKLDDIKIRLESTKTQEQKELEKNPNLLAERALGIKFDKSKLLEKIQTDLIPNKMLEITRNQLEILDVLRNSYNVQTKTYRSFTGQENQYIKTVNNRQEVIDPITGDTISITEREKLNKIRRSKMGNYYDKVSKQVGIKGKFNNWRRKIFEEREKNITGVNSNLSKDEMLDYGVESSTFSNHNAEEFLENINQAKSQTTKSKMGLSAKDTRHQMHNLLFENQEVRYDVNRADNIYDVLKGKAKSKLNNGSSDNLNNNLNFEENLNNFLNGSTGINTDNNYDNSATVKLHDETLACLKQIICDCSCCESYDYAYEYEINKKSRIPLSTSFTELVPSQLSLPPASSQFSLSSNNHYDENEVNNKIGLQLSSGLTPSITDNINGINIKKKDDSIEVRENKDSTNIAIIAESLLPISKNVENISKNNGKEGSGVWSTITGILVSGFQFIQSILSNVWGGLKWAIGGIAGILGIKSLPGFLKKSPKPSNSPKFKLKGKGVLGVVGGLAAAYGANSAYNYFSNNDENSNISKNDDFNDVSKKSSGQIKPNNSKNDLSSNLIYGGGAIASGIGINKVHDIIKNKKSQINKQLTDITPSRKSLPTSGSQVIDINPKVEQNIPHTKPTIVVNPDNKSTLPTIRQSSELTPNSKPKPKFNLKGNLKKTALGGIGLYGLYKYLGMENGYTHDKIGLSDESNYLKNLDSYIPFGIGDAINSIGKTNEIQPKTVSETARDYSNSTATQAGISYLTQANTNRFDRTGKKLFTTNIKNAKEAVTGFKANDFKLKFYGLNPIYTQPPSSSPTTPPTVNTGTQPPTSSASVPNKQLPSGTGITSNVAPPSTSSASVPNKQLPSGTGVTSNVAPPSNVAGITGATESPNIFKRMATGIKSTVSDAWDSTKQFASSTWSKGKEFIGEQFDKLKSWIIDKAKPIIEPIQRIYEKIKKIKSIAKILSYFEKAIVYIKQFCTMIVNASKIWKPVFKALGIISFVFAATEIIGLIGGEHELYNGFGLTLKIISLFCQLGSSVMFAAFLGSISFGILPIIMVGIGLIADVIATKYGKNPNLILTEEDLEEFNKKQQKALDDAKSQEKDLSEEAVIEPSSSQIKTEQYRKEVLSGEINPDGVSKFDLGLSNNITKSSSSVTDNTSPPTSNSSTPSTSSSTISPPISGSPSIPSANPDGISKYDLGLSNNPATPPSPMTNPEPPNDDPSSENNSKEANSNNDVKPPSDHNVITSPMGMRNGKMHRGIDVRAKNNESVYSMASGKVVEVGDKWGSTWVKQNDGLYAGYLHMNSKLKKTGDEVNAGEKIGLSGGVGPNGAGQYQPHLHLEMNKKGVWNSAHSGSIVDPASYLAENGISMNGSSNKAKDTEASASKEASTSNATESSAPSANATSETASANNTSSENASSTNAAGTSAEAPTSTSTEATSANGVSPQLTSSSSSEAASANATAPSLTKSSMLSYSNKDENQVIGINPIKQITPIPVNERVSKQSDNKSEENSTGTGYSPTINNDTSNSSTVIQGGSGDGESRRNQDRPMGGQTAMAFLNNLLNNTLVSLTGGMQSYALGQTQSGILR